MLRSLAVLTLMVFMLGSVGAFAADKYNIDPPHSSVGFKVKHLVVSTTSGRFNEFEGHIMFDENNISNSSVEFTIDAASIDTDNEDRDKHLRSADFFEVEKYPEITFKSTKVENTKNGYFLHGKLTMHGVTKDVTFPFEYNGSIQDPWGNTRIGFDAYTELDRKEYGIEWNKVLDSGGLTVSNEVKIEIHLEAIKAK